MKKSIYKIYKRYKEDFWNDLVKGFNLNTFLVLKLVLYNKRLYRTKKEDLRYNFLFAKKKYTQRGLVFLNKQKLRYFYFNINLSQFKKYFLYAQKQRFNLIDNFFGILESRIDVILYRLNFVSKMFESKHLLLNKKVFINNQNVTKPSFLVKPGDQIYVNDNTFKTKLLNIFKEPNFMVVACPKYLEVNYKIFNIIFLYRPSVEEIFFPFFINYNLALQYFKDIT